MHLTGKINWWSKLAEYSTYLFFILFPFLNYTSFLYFGSSTRSINLIMLSSLLALFLGFLLLKKETTLSVSKSPILIAIATYFICVIISAISGGHFATSFYSTITRTTGIWYLLCLGFFLLTLIHISRDEMNRRRLILCIILPAALYSLLSFLGPEGLNFIFKAYKLDGFTFGNSSFAGMYLFASFLLSIYFLVSEKKKSFWKWLVPAVLVINPYIINHLVWIGDISSFSDIVGEARASAYVFAASLIALAALYCISRIKQTTVRDRISYAIFGLSIVSIFVAGVSLLSPNGYLRGVYLSQASGARPLVWEISHKLINEKPIVGWGIDNFERTYELHYDSRVLEQRHGNEAWFDRAHNVFVDQTFDNGYLGLFLYCLIYIITGFCLVVVALKSKKRNSRVLASVLMTYFALHLLEIQTAFDTSISFAIIVVMFAFAVSLFSETMKENKNKETNIEILPTLKYLFAALLIVVSLWSVFYAAVPFIRSQIANGEIRTAGSISKRIALYDTLFGSKVDLPAVIWRTSTDFQRGIRENPQVIQDPKKAALLIKEMGIYEKIYEDYIAKNPDNFRAILSLADIKIYLMLFGVDKLAEAQVLADKAMKLVPTAPHPYWLKAVAYLYMQKFDLAREYAQKGLQLDPDAITSQEVAQYINDSIKAFPDIDLYFFKQI